VAVYLPKAELICNKGYSPWRAGRVDRRDVLRVSTLIDKHVHHCHMDICRRLLLPYARGSRHAHVGTAIQKVSAPPVLAPQFIAY
jgi:preprotein translocase subunit SecB